MQTLATTKHGKIYNYRDMSHMGRLRQRTHAASMHAHTYIYNLG